MTVMSPDGQRFPAHLPVTAMRTYAVARPLATHFRPATCEETACPAWLFGWLTKVDESTDLGQRQAHYIRHDKSRRHVETRAEDGLTVFTFEPGQRCFNTVQHKLPLDKPEIYTVRDGDWRGNPTGRVMHHQSADDWVEDFGEHQDALADRLERG